MISQLHVVIPASTRTLLWMANKKTNLLLHLCSSNVSVFVGNNLVTHLTGFRVIDNNNYIPIILDNGDSLYAISDTLATIEILVQA